MDNPDNIAKLRAWVIAQGVAPKRAERMKEETLHKCFEAPNYLRKVIAISRAVDGAEPAPIDAEPALDPCPVETQPAPKTEPLNQRVDTATARKLADLIASIGGPVAELDEKRVIELIREHAPKPATYHVTISAPGGAPKALPDEPRHVQFPQILRAVQCGNVFLRGPAGSGKTTLAEQVARALGLQFYFTGAVASEFKLVGYRNAMGELIRTAFREAYEHGGLFLFDEIDASAPAALLAFNAGLSNGHMDFPDGVIPRHANFHCIAAGNTFGQGADRVYVGRNQLDGATLDRFIFIDLNYDETLERALAPKADWVDYVQSVRRAVEKLKLRHVVSPRASIMGCKLLAAGASRTETEATLLWRGLDGETVAKIKSNAR